MKNTKRKKAKEQAEPETRLTIDALAALTSSDIVSQVKAGMSRIAPIEVGDDDESDLPY